jgi:hypothetical protein
MKTLYNGATLIAHERNVVLAKHAFKEEWVVWTLDPNGHTFSGRYSESLRNAVDEFYWRLENGAGEPVEPVLQSQMVVPPYASGWYVDWTHTINDAIEAVHGSLDYSGEVWEAIQLRCVGERLGYPEDPTFFVVDQGMALCIMDDLEGLEYLKGSAEIAKRVKEWILQFTFDVEFRVD